MWAATRETDGHLSRKHLRMCSGIFHLPSIHLCFQSRSAATSFRTQYRVWLTFMADTPAVLVCCGTVYTLPPLEITWPAHLSSIPPLNMQSISVLPCCSVVFAGKRSLFSLFMSSLIIFTDRPWTRWECHKAQAKMSHSSLFVWVINPCRYCLKALKPDYFLLCTKQQTDTISDQLVSTVEHWATKPLRVWWRQKYR